MSQSNCSKSPLDSNSPPPPINENHKARRKGVYIPLEIWHLFEQGKMSTIKLRTLMLVHDLVDPMLVGCWASNTWLSKRLGISKSRVSHIISELCGEGHLSEAGTLTLRNLKFRLLMSRWAPLQLRAGESIRERRKRSDRTFRKTNRCFAKVVFNKEVLAPRVANPCYGSPAPDIPTIAESSYGRLAESSYHSISSTTYKKEGGGRLRRDPPLNGSACTASKEDLRLAEALHTGLRSSNRVCNRFSGKWADDLRLCKEVDHQDDLPALITWYVGHCSKEDSTRLGLPTIKSAADFRKHCDWIRDKKVRSGGTNGQPAPISVELDPACQAILAEVRETPWRAGKEHLPQAIQITAETYRALNRKLNALEEGRTDGLDRFANHFAADYLPGLKAFVIRWFEDVYKDVGKWQRWNGSMVQEAFTLTSPRFLAMLNDASEQFSGKLTYANRMLTYLKGQPAL